ncbi:MAG TPA: autotransporter domain-containing protein [Allosphingosinicella sp.]
MSATAAAALFGPAQTAFAQALPMPAGAPVPLSGSAPIQGTAPSPEPQIVIANPGTATTARDSGITGVGQVVTDNGGGSVGLCTGTLINPRTVIFAAHCVNSRAATAYGAGSGGTGISVGFSADNLPALRSWLFPTVSGGAANPMQFKSDPGMFIYNVNQVRYNAQSTETAARGFLYADVATATLDTHAADIPVWAMLFSQLPATSPGAGGTGYNVQIAGYGANGNATIGATGGTDFRRRIAENVLGAFTDLKTFETFLYGSSSSPTQNLYFLDFDDPLRGQQGASPYDFNAFRDNARGTKEGITAPGDSGGPLVLQNFGSGRLTAGVLSGGYTRFYNGQPAYGYGTVSFYQPLFLYWDWIAENNPYRYVTNVAGDRSWTSAENWVTTLDPNYMIINSNGQVVNGVPTTPGLGKNGTGGDFGEACFQTLTTSECLNTATGQITLENKPIGTGIDSSIGVTGRGDLLIASPESQISVVSPPLPAATIANGLPGARNFVPNNVDPVRATGAIGRYFDVTLAAAGTTTLNLGSSVTIDRLAMAGAGTRLNVQGALTVLDDYNHITGTTEIKGTMKTGEAFMLTGVLGGTGKFTTPYLTVVAGTVAPGQLLTQNNMLTAYQATPGTLTVAGNVILASGSVLAIDIVQGTADKLAVTRSSTNSTDGILTLSNGTAAFTRNSANIVRAGQTATFATAEGGIQGRFGNALGYNLGVLTPRLSYQANSAQVTFEAGSLVTQASLVPTTTSVTAFAQTLDKARLTSYNSLSGLYGAVDLMDPAALNATLSGLTPDIASETRSMQDRQSMLMLNTLGDRLSMLGTPGTGNSLSLVGSPGSALAISSGEGSAPQMAQRSLAASATNRGGMRLPAGFSGFISGGVSATGAATVGAASRYSGQQISHVGMGLERRLDTGLTFGTAFGVARGHSALQGSASQSSSRSTQAAFYGAYRFDGGVYLGWLAAATYSRSDMRRTASTGMESVNLSGATKSSRYNVQAEAGVNLEVARGLTLTPRTALRFTSAAFGGYREAGGELALQLDSVKVKQLEGRFGFALNGSTALGGGWKLTPKLNADLVQNLSGADAGLTVAFAAAPEYAFELPLANGDKRWAEVRGGFSLDRGDMALGFGIEKNVGRSDYRDERAVADFTVRF